MDLEPISVEMHIILSIMFVVLSVAFAGLVYFLKRQFELTWVKMETLSEMRIACREQLPARFADKQETKESIVRLWKRIDEIKDHLSSFERQRSD